MKAKTAPGELVRWLAAKRGISVEEASRALAELAQVRVRLAAETEAEAPAVSEAPAAAPEPPEAFTLSVPMASWNTLSPSRAMARIYLASSWRNEQQPAVLRAMREAGHQVYDFRNPTPGNHGFSWRQITPEERPWSAARTREVLSHPIAEEGFGLDFRAMQWADTFVMLQPCGRSAALELGWAAGAGKRTLVLLADGQEPELMLKVADRLCLSIAEVLEDLSTPRPSARGRAFHAEVALMGHKDLGDASRVRRGL